MHTEKVEELKKTIMEKEQIESIPDYLLAYYMIKEYGIEEYNKYEGKYKFVLALNLSTINHFSHEKVKDCIDEHTFDVIMKLSRKQQIEFINKCIEIIIDEKLFEVSQKLIIEFITVISKIAHNAEIYTLLMGKIESVVDIDCYLAWAIVMSRDLSLEFINKNPPRCVSLEFNDDFNTLYMLRHFEEKPKNWGNLYKDNRAHINKEFSKYAVKNNMILELCNRFDEINLDVPIELVRELVKKIQ